MVIDNLERFQEPAPAIGLPFIAAVRITELLTVIIMEKLASTKVADTFFSYYIVQYIIPDTMLFYHVQQFVSSPLLQLMLLLCHQQTDHGCLPSVPKRSNETM